MTASAPGLGWPAQHPPRRPPAPGHPGPTSEKPPPDAGGLALASGQPTSAAGQPAPASRTIPTAGQSASGPGQPASAPWSARLCSGSARLGSVGPGLLPVSRSSAAGQSGIAAGQPASAPGQPASAAGQPAFAPGQPVSAPGRPASDPGQSGPALGRHASSSTGSPPTVPSRADRMARRSAHPDVPHSAYPYDLSWPAPPPAPPSSAAAPPAGSALSTAGSSSAGPPSAGPPSAPAQDTAPTTPRAETGLGWPAITRAGHPAGPPRFHGPPQPAPPHQPDASLTSPSQSALPASSPTAPPSPTGVSSAIPAAPVAPSPIVPRQASTPGLTGFPQAVDNSAVHLPPRALTPEVDQAQRASAGPADLSTGQTEPPTGQPAALEIRLLLLLVGRDNTPANQPCRPCRPPRRIGPLHRQKPGHHQPLGHRQARPRRHANRPRLALPRRSPRQPRHQTPPGWHRFQFRPPARQTQPATSPVPGTSCLPAYTHPRPVTPTRPSRPHRPRPSAHRRCRHLMGRHTRQSLANLQPASRLRPCSPGDRRQSCRPRVGRPRITRSRAIASRPLAPGSVVPWNADAETGRRRETRPRRSRQHGHHLRRPRPQGFRLRESRVRRCRPIGHRGPPVRLGPFCRRSPGRTRRNRCPTSRPSGRNPGFLATSACREPRRRAQSSSAPGRRALRRPVACRRVIPTNQELDSQASWNQVLAQWARDRRLGHGGRLPVSISQHSVRREVPGDWNLSLPGGLPPRRRQDRLRWCRPCLRCPHR